MLLTTFSRLRVTLLSMQTHAYMFVFRVSYLSYSESYLYSTYAHINPTYPQSIVRTQYHLNHNIIEQYSAYACPPDQRDPLLSGDALMLLRHLLTVMLRSGSAYNPAAGSNWLMRSLRRATVAQ